MHAGRARCAATFVYDLSSRLIAITTAFAGTQVLLYGAAPGGRAARSPWSSAARRATPPSGARAGSGPIWINTSSLEFRDVPSFYAVAASVPLDELAGPSALARHELGAERLRLTPATPQDLAADEVDAFRAALVRNQQRAGLFSAERRAR